MGTRANNTNIVEAVTAELRLPKASRTGEAHIFRDIMAKKDGEFKCQRKILTIPKMNLMALIGINDYERQAKQVIVATLDVEYFDLNVTAGEKEFPEDAAYVLEQVLIVAISNSSFKTLEALVHFAARSVSEEFTQRGFGSATVHLTLEKPKAIAFADAAVVEHTIPAKR